MTNLLAAIVVALSTNTVERVTGYASHVGIPCPDGMFCAVYHTQGVDPNEKTITTTARRTTTLTFDWMGKAQSVEHVEVLWESNKVVRLEWRESPTPLAKSGVAYPFPFTGTITNVQHSILSK